MDIFVVIQQMCVMLLIILTGYLLFRKNKLNDLSARHISGLVVNVCNPAVLVCSAFDNGSRASSQQLVTALFATLLLYAVLLLAGFLIPRLLHAPRTEFDTYHFLTVYGNVGFLGIPLVSAVLGSGALIYVSINCLIFNLLFYTCSIRLIQKKAGIVRKKGLRSLSGLINAGTISALFTVIFYLGGFQAPMVIRDTFTHAGKATTFLSMLVLGVSVAQMPLKEIFCHKKDYLFILLRMILLPAGCVLLLRSFVTDPLILNTCILLVCVPAANLPLMCSREHGLPADALARQIILTTLLSIVTIPVVAVL